MIIISNSGNGTQPLIIIIIYFNVDISLLIEQINDYNFSATQHILSYI